MRTLVLAVVAVLAAVAAGSAAARTDVNNCLTGDQVTTASYHMALDIGPQENMYLPSEVKARHITKGEIMLGGEMSMTNMTPKGDRIYHVEVHICTKAGVVVQHLKPQIDVGMTMVPAARMVGIGETIANDYHYGNDVALKPGARVAVKVTVKGQVALFHATVPK